MQTFIYNRSRSLLYARRWAYRRNPLFFDFAGSGGNCTNFVSQCILAGSCIMNFTETFGWYYISTDDRAPAWTGVEFLYNFLISNSGVGPFGYEAEVRDLQVGDVVQLMNSDGVFYHTLIVTGYSDGDILIAAQTNDAFDRPISTYNYEAARGIHIEGVRSDSGMCECFNDLFNGISLPQCGEEM